MKKITTIIMALCLISLIVGCAGPQPKYTSDSSDISSDTAEVESLDTELSDESVDEIEDIDSIFEDW